MLKTIDQLTNADRNGENKKNMSFGDKYEYEIEFEIGRINLSYWYEINKKCKVAKINNLLNPCFHIRVIAI